MKLLPPHLQMNVWLSNMQLEPSRGREPGCCNGRGPSSGATGEFAFLAMRSIFVAIYPHRSRSRLFRIAKKTVRYTRARVRGAE